MIIVANIFCMIKTSIVPTSCVPVAMPTVTVWFLMIMRKRITVT